MPPPPSLVGTFDRGSFFAPKYEMRLTARCIDDDLGRRGVRELYRLRNQEIVKAFINQRQDSHEGTRQVTPLTCGEEIWVLPRGDDHRGATWLDPKSEVLWLCAYHFHRSGDQDDAFPHFRELDADDRLLPSPEDVLELVKERRGRFARLVVGDTQDLLQRATDNPGKEQAAVIGGAVPTGLHVEVVETLEEIAVAMEVDLTTRKDMALAVLNALQPDLSFSDWQPWPEMPERMLREGEVCWRHMKG